GVIEFCMLLWTQIGLQHGVEMAARCISINTSLCNSVASTQGYASQQAYGLWVPTSAFTVSTPACGNQVSASYAFGFVTSYFGIPAITLTARSCFPKSRGDA